MGHKIKNEVRFQPCLMGLVTAGHKIESKAGLLFDLNMHTATYVNDDVNN